MADQEESVALPPWEDVADKYQAAFPGLPAEHIQKRYEAHRNLALARSRVAGDEDTAGSLIARHSIPVASALGDVSGAVNYGQARKRFETGNPERQDYQTIADYERVQEREAQRNSTLLGKAGTALLKAPAMFGEALGGGALLKGAGLVGTATAKSAAVAVPLYTARLGATTATVPSFYAKQWTDNNLEQGRDALDIRGLPAAYGVAMTQNAILGQISNLPRWMPGAGRLNAMTGPGGVASRMAAAGGLGVGETAAADVGTGLLQDQARKIIPEWTRKETHYGTLGDMRDGKYGEAAQNAVVQAMTFALFRGIHEGIEGTPAQKLKAGVKQFGAEAEAFAQEQGQRARKAGVRGEKFVEEAAQTTGSWEPLQDYFRSMGRSDKSLDAATAGLDIVNGRVAQVLKGNPDPSRAEVHKAFEDMPEGPAKTYARTVADSFPEKTKPTPAPPAPQNAPPAVPAGQKAPEVVQPAATPPGAAQTPAPLSAQEAMGRVDKAQEVLDQIAGPKKKGYQGTTVFKQAKEKLLEAKKAWEEAIGREEAQKQAAPAQPVPARLDALREEFFKAGGKPAHEEGMVRKLGSVEKVDAHYGGEETPRTRFAKAYARELFGEQAPATPPQEGVAPQTAHARQYHYQELLRNGMSEEAARAEVEREFPSQGPQQVPGLGAVEVPPREGPPAPEAKPVPGTVQPIRSTEEVTTPQEVVKAGAKAAPEVVPAGRKVEVPEKPEQLSPKEKALHDQVEKAVEESDQGHPGEIAGLVNKERGRRGERKLSSDEIDDVLDSLEGQQRIKKDGDAYSKALPAKSPTPASTELQEVFDKAKLTPVQQSELLQYYMGLKQEEIGGQRNVGRAAVSASMFKAIGKLEEAGFALPESARGLIDDIKAQSKPEGKTKLLTGGEGLHKLGGGSVKDYWDKFARGTPVDRDELHAETAKELKLDGERPEEQQLGPDGAYAKVFGELLDKETDRARRQATRSGISTAAAEEALRTGESAGQAEAQAGQPGEAAPGAGDSPAAESILKEVQKAGEDDVASIREMRKKLGLSKKVFDDTVLQLSEQGKVYLVPDSRAGQLSEGERAELVKHGEDYYGQIGLREAPAAQPPGAAEVPVKEPGTVRRPLPPLKDNYRKPLSVYTDTLYRETNVDRAEEFLPNSRVVTRNPFGEVVELANSQELALGQGKNKGVLLEFDPGTIEGTVNLKKPGAELAYESGHAEFISRHNQIEDFRPLLRSVTVKPEAKGQNSRLLKKLLQELESQGWTKESLPDGSVRWNRPEPSAAEFGKPLNPEETKVGEGNRLGAGLMGEEASVGIDRVIQVVKESYGDLKEGAEKFGDDLKELLAPATRGEQAGVGAGAMRENLAAMVRKRQIAEKVLEAGRDHFEKWIVNEKDPTVRQAKFLQVTDAIEEGKIDTLPKELQPIAESIRKLTDERTQQLKDKGILSSFIENYFGHLWKKPGSTMTPEEIGQMMAARRPLEGTEGFKRKRSIPTYREGIETHGLEPQNWNPVELALTKLHEMDRAIMAHDVVEELKANNLWQFVRLGGDVPEGWRRIEDKVATMFAPRKAGAAGPELVGHHYTPEPVARLLDNYLQRGLRGKMWYDSIRGFGNLLNQFQLGFSAFHAGFVTMDTMVSAMSLGLQQITRGKFLEGLKNIATFPAEPIMNWFRGSKMMKEWYSPGSQGAETAEMIDNLVKAGGRVSMDNFYKGNHIEAFRKALGTIQRGEGGTFSLLYNALPALGELVSKPIMEHLVPRMKLGVFSELARAELAALPPGADANARKAALGKAWDSVENRLGQLTYDNVFWNRTFKDVLMAGVRSVGWNLGTIRELGGGVKDVPRALGGKGLSPRLAYLIALPMGTAFYAAVYQYLATGKGPEELMDLVAPKTGKTRKDGTPDRVQLPSYMRDLTHLANRADEGPLRWVRNAWDMGKGKINPALGIVAQMLDNKDYQGADISNPNDPAVKQSLDTLKHLGLSFESFSLRNIRHGLKEGSVSEGLQGMIGITPAPSRVVHTSQQQRAAESKRKVEMTPLQKLLKKK